MAASGNRRETSTASPERMTRTEGPPPGPGSIARPTRSALSQSSGRTELLKKKLPSAPGRRSDGADQRQIEAHDQAAPGQVFGLDPTAERLEIAPCRPQADPAMGLAVAARGAAQRKAAFEDALLVLDRHAGAIVHHIDFRSGAGLDQAQLDPAAFGREADGIVEHGLDRGLDQLLA